MDRQLAIRVAEEVVKWCNSIHEKGSPGTFRIVLDVARNGESHQNKIMERTGTTQSITAHAVLTMSKQSQKGAQRDRAVLENIMDDNDRRQRLVSLTPYGELTVQRLAGHKDLATTQRYTHFSDPHLEDAIATLSKDEYTSGPMGDYGNSRVDMGKHPQKHRHS